MEEQTRLCVGARGTLESSHVATSQQIQDVLQTINSILAAEAAVLVRGEKERLMAKLRSVAEAWLREAAEMGAALKVSVHQTARFQPRPA